MQQQAEHQRQDAKGLHLAAATADAQRCGYAPTKQPLAQRYAAAAACELEDSQAVHMSGSHMDRQEEALERDCPPSFSGWSDSAGTLRQLRSYLTSSMEHTVNLTVSPSEKPALSRCTELQGPNLRPHQPVQSERRRSSSASEIHPHQVSSTTGGTAAAGGLNAFTGRHQAEHQGSQISVSSSGCMSSADRYSAAELSRSPPAGSTAKAAGRSKSQPCSPCGLRRDELQNDTWFVAARQQGAPRPHDNPPHPPEGARGFAGSVSPRAAFCRPATSNSMQRAATVSPAHSSNTTAATQPQGAHISSSGTRRPHNSQSAGFSPGAAAIVISGSSSSSSSSNRHSSSLLMQHSPASSAKAAEFAGTGSLVSIRPVARDITQRLQSLSIGVGDLAGDCLTTPSGSQQEKSLWDAWEQHQHQQHERMDRRQSVPAGSAGSHHETRMQQQAAPPLVRPGSVERIQPLIHRPFNTHCAAAGVPKSPAPPSVPPSPQQQHAAEIRVRRSSCSNIPAGTTGTLAASPRSALSTDPGHVAGAAGEGPQRRNTGLEQTGLSITVVSPAHTSDVMWDVAHTRAGSPGRITADPGQHNSLHGALPQQQPQQPAGQAPAAAGREGVLSTPVAAAHPLLGSTLDQVYILSGSPQQPTLMDLHSDKPAWHSLTPRSQPYNIKVAARQVLDACKRPPHPPLQATPQEPVAHAAQLHMLRSASAAANDVANQQHLPQQPLPPRQSLPSCRSPCVNARLHASTALSPARTLSLGSGAFSSQHTPCSPILEQGLADSSCQPCEVEGAGSGSDVHITGSVPSSTTSAALGTCPSTVGSAGDAGLATTPAGFSSSGSSSSSARAYASGMRTPLPRPAFDHLVRPGSVDSSFSKHQRPSGNMLTSPRLPTGPEAAATMRSSRVLRTLSPMPPKPHGGNLTTTSTDIGGSTSSRNDHACSKGVHVSSNSSRDVPLRLPPKLQAPMSPSPPPSARVGAAAMLVSPRWDAQGVQPSPPAHSLQLPPSPAVRVRVAAQDSSHTSSQPHHAADMTLPASGAASVSASCDGTGLVSTPVLQRKALRPQTLLRPDPSEQSTEGSSTPNMAWMQAAVPPVEQHDLASPIDAGARAAHSTAGPTPPPSAASDRCPSGWPAVVAFAHYKGRFGYLTNTGVLGVLFDDVSHLLQHASGSHTVYCLTTVVTQGSAGHADCAAVGRAVADKAAGKAVGSSHVGRHLSRQLGADVRRSDQHVDQGQHPPAPGQSSLAVAPTRHHVDVECLELAVQSDGVSGGVPPDVPQELAAKVHCLQRFARCLLHHKPYSQKKHLDVMRLSVPHCLREVQQQQQVKGPKTTGLLPKSMVHVTRFTYSEGCVQLSLSDGSQQLVFTRDGTVMLLQPDRAELAVIMPAAKHRRQQSSRSSERSAALAAAHVVGSETDGSSSDDTSVSSDAAEPRVLTLPLCSSTGVPDDDVLRSRLLFASRLPDVSPLLPLMCSSWYTPAQ